MNKLSRSTILRLVILVSTSIMFLACEEDTSIKIDGKNPPSFSLSGSGALISFGVTEVPPENQTQTIQRRSDGNIPLWSIQPTNGDNKIWGLPTITYGKVPAGFTQQFPLDGSAPAQLVEGKIYEAVGGASQANGELIWFKVQGDKTVQIPIPGRSQGVATDSPKLK